MVGKKRGKTPRKSVECIERESLEVTATPQALHPFLMITERCLPLPRRKEVLGRKSAKCNGKPSPEGGGIVAIPMTFCINCVSVNSSHTGGLVMFRGASRGHEAQWETECLRDAPESHQVCDPAGCFTSPDSWMAFCIFEPLESLSMDLYKGTTGSTIEILSAKSCNSFSFY